MAANKQPDNEIRDLAKWATDDLAAKKAFRIEAQKPNNFRAAVAASGGPQLTTEEAIHFCEGWLYLARLEYGDIDADGFDQQIVIRVQAHLQQGISTMNG